MNRKKVISLIMAVYICFAFSSVVAAQDYQKKAGIATQDFFRNVQPVSDTELAEIEGEVAPAAVWFAKKTWKKATKWYKNSRESQGDWCPTWFMCAKPLGG